MKGIPKMKVKVQIQIVSAAIALAVSAAFAKGQGNDKSVGWPMADHVLQNVLDSQMDCGGWGKNMDKRKVFDEKKREKVIAKKGDVEDATIDNNATTTEIRYLVRWHGQKKDEASLKAALRGVDWLLASQLPNGGWPQFPARKSGYWTQITFNDNAMRNVLELMRDIAAGEGDFAVFDDERRAKCKAALEKGIGCVLKCQIRVDGKPTVWCQQHDRDTLVPVDGRAYELKSFCSQESAEMVLFLMEIENPSPEVIEAVNGAVEWFRKTRLEDGRWARFYDFEEVKPFFCDRSGVPKRDVKEIDPKRQRGYSWFNKKGDKVLKKYEKWQWRKS